MTLLLLYFTVWLVQKTYAIRCKTKTNHDLIAAFSRALGSLLGFIMSSHWLTDSLLINFSVGFFLSSDWPLLLLCIWFYSIEKDRKALFMKPMKTECTVYGTTRFFGVPLPYTRKFYASLWIQLNVHLHRWGWGKELLQDNLVFINWVDNVNWPP